MFRSAKLQSLIIPADIITNLEYQKDKVDGIELVLFESDKFSNLPFSEDLQRSYSVHLLLDVYLGNPDRAEGERSVGKYLRIIELTRDLPIEIASLIALPPLLLMRC